jgi:hypothetical protein
LNVTKTQADLALKQKQLAADFRIKQLELELEALKLQHGDQNAAANREVDALAIHADNVNRSRDRMQESVQHKADLRHEAIQNSLDREVDALELHHDTSHRNADRLTQAMPGPGPQGLNP